MQVTISAKATVFQAALDSLSEHLPDVAPEFRQLVLDRLDRLFQLGCVDLETLPTSAAGELRIELKPSKAFLEFVAAVRTGQLDALLAEVRIHE